MERILGNIYLGSYQPLAVGVDLTKSNITHILSIITGDLPRFVNNFQHLQICIDDLEDVNIIEHFARTNAFIDEAIDKKEGIFIHCSQGVSRSVAFLVAYLMYKYKLSLKNSLYAVKRKRSGAQPNDGFMEQLRIYEEALQHVEYKYQQIDLQNEEKYRDWVFKNQMEDDAAREKFLGNKESFKTFKQDEGLILRCKKCRQVVGDKDCIVEHVPPSEESRHSKFFTTSGYSNRIIGVENASKFCSHKFVEPLIWMQEELMKGELLGKLHCPNEKCGTKIGTYSWKGSRCSCGQWVVPGISLQTAKVDEINITNTLQKMEKVRQIHD